MKKWIGSAGICVNEKNEMLMVLQGQPHKKKVWSIPSGGKELNETYEECCIREISEETGYEVGIVKSLFVKEGNSYGFDVIVHYFEVEVVGGECKIQDPDGLIYEVSWKSVNELKELDLSFPEDREYLISFIQEKNYQKQ
ncbi:NUDIX hydrolase [Bacillus sp. RG28]|uniref:NUDIX hydrolase n=1 Tax=Gottfriedia endophytica TaxID=2820819 RepID=A0A940NN68_9BACI|nr:NUDIX hydrolase [Gottfriedia endophytica]MBP0725234.1 NUDIX hydrolase [Gottfriedia endophytica]